MPKSRSAVGRLDGQPPVIVEHPYFKQHQIWNKTQIFG